MKKLLLITIISCMSAGVYAQSKKYVTAMEKNVAILDTTGSMNGYQQAANSFERVANAEKKEWLPSYYIAFCNVMMAGIESKGDMVDAYCDKADRYLDIADSLSPNNSEVYTLKALVNSMRIKVNPMGRGAKYGTESGMNTSKAKELDPTNPRPYLLEGQGKMYTPPAFGGGKDKAVPILEEAVKKFEAFKPASKIAPHWGEAHAKKMLEECKK
jgi:hypothetical protein